MGIFFHIDVNSAFLSWTALEQLENGNTVDIRTIPSIVGGDSNTRHGIVLAKSIPAKAYGIQTAEPVVNAFRKCPTLTMVPPNHTMYQQRSKLFIDYLTTICPDIHQVSIDECYMDYTPIADKYPSPEIAASIIKDSVYKRFGFTVNVGISDRKVLAKMASDFKKPNLVHTLYSHEISAKLWPLPVSKLFMCGHSSVEILHKLGIRTVGDLAHADKQILQAHLKSHGITLWEYANGIDTSDITPEPVKTKGIGHSTTLSQDVVTSEEAYRTLLGLAESVGTRLRHSHELATMVSTEIKYASFRSVSHQTTLGTPTASTTTIYQTACKLFDELWDGSPVRLLGIRTSKLVADTEPQQMNLFDYQQDSPKSEKQQKLDSALDKLRGKYGTDIIKRGSLLDSPKPSKK